MSEQNPYQPPAANIEMAASPGQLSGAKSVAIGRGLSWYGEGFEIFKQNPWIWILNIVLCFIIMALLNAVPFVSILSSLLYPVFVAGLILGCRDLDEGNELKVSHVFAGFQHRTGPLIGLGAINLVLSILFVAVIFGVMFAMGSLDFDAMETGQMSNEQAMSMVLAGLVAMLFMIPLIMLFWFAPTLVVLNDEIGIIEAMKLSFLGCIKNILPFLIYGIVGLILMVLATLPLALGWLVLAPVFLGTVYAGYKDIFLK
ncbi:MAG: hypothetical protein HKM94_11890 [Halobacteria archaeon]|nr:hypothetical protein [Halobacteria archaeon]